jgi:N-methylhydantoinase A
VREVVVPLGQVASAFSAYGLASSDIVLAAELSDPGPMPLDAERAAANFARLEEQVRGSLEQQGLTYERVELVRSLDMRFTAQLAEIEIDVPDGVLDSTAVQLVADNFEKRYAELYGEGTGFAAAGVQAITFRVRGTGVLPFSPELPVLEAAASADPSAARISSRKVCLDPRAGYVDTPVYDYRGLRAGHVIEGPAIVEVSTTTVVVPGAMSGTVDHLGNLSILTQ